MQRRAADFALGWRLAQFSGYVPAVRAFLVVVAAAALTIVSLAAIAALAVSDAQTAKAGARSVLWTATDDAQFEALDPRLLPDRLWNGHRVERQFLASSDPDGAPVPPGVTEFPRPGTTYVSPALRELLRTDRVVQQLFADYRLVGTIGRDGLTGPAELRAVVGASPTAQNLRPARGFGASNAVPNDDARVNLVVTVFLIILIAIPTLSLMVMSVRMSSHERRRRSAVLTQVGLSKLRIAGVMSLETVIPVAIGNALGILLFSLARRSMTHVPLTNVSFYSSDVQPPWWSLLAVPAIVLLAALAIAARQGGRPRQSTRPTLQSSRFSRLRIAPLALGFAGMALWLGAGRTGSAVAAYGFWLLLLTLAAGIVISGPVLVRLVAGVLQPRAGVGTSVGLAFAANRSTATTHLAGIVAVTLLAVGTSTPFVNVLNGGREDRAAAVLADARGVSLVVPGSGDVVDAVAERWEGVTQALSAALVDTSIHAQIGVVFATCAQIQDLSRAAIHGCSNTAVWLAPDTSSTGPLPASARLQPSEDHRHALRLPPPHRTLIVPGLSQDLSGYLLVPPEQSGQVTIGPQHRQLILQVEDDMVSGIIARLASALPSTIVRSGEFAYQDTDQARFPDQVQWIRFGAILCGLMGALALAMAAVGDATPRRQQLLGLLRIGPPTRAIVAAHVAATGLPLVVLSLLGTLAGWLSYLALTALDDRAFSPPGYYLVLAGAGLAVAAAVVAISVRPIIRPVTRHEVTDLGV